MFFNNYRCHNIKPEELQGRLEGGSNFLLLDVRTPEENKTDSIANSHLIPLQQLSDRLNELPRDQEIVVYCRVGNRSAYACSFLASRGYNVKNLEGGIVRWNMTGSAAMSMA
jgi:rhodanese-related sulfurtransferase